MQSVYSTAPANLLVWTQVLMMSALILRNSKQRTNNSWHCMAELMKNQRPSVTGGLDSTVHLLTGLCETMRCLLHKAQGGVTKDKGKKEKSNSNFEELDLLIHGVICITLHVPLALFPNPASGTNSMLQDPSRSPPALGAAVDSLHLTLVAFFDQLIPMDSSDQFFFASLTTLVYMKGWIFPTFGLWTTYRLDI